MGVAVILLDWHRPSDVLGAYLVTVAWTALVAAGLLTAHDAGGLAATRRRRAAGARAAGALTVGLGAVFGIIVGVQAARRIDLLRVVHDRTAFAAAAIVCAAACALLTAWSPRSSSAGPPPPPGRAPGRLASCASACSRVEGTAPD